MLKYKKDFYDYPNYVEEISYIEPILKDLPDIENMKNDKRLNLIFSSSRFRGLSFMIYRLDALPQSVCLRNPALGLREVQHQNPKPDVLPAKELQAKRQ